MAALGRISSFGQLKAESSHLKAEGVPLGGLAPDGFADAYDIRPLWHHGDLGQGETIVFFEVDGYLPSDLATYASRFGLPPFADPLPHIGPLNLKPAGEQPGPGGGARARARREAGLRQPELLRR